MRLLLVLFLTLTMARSSRAECPADTMSVLGVTTTTTAPRDEAFLTGSDCQEYPYYCWERDGAAVYDLVAGTTYVSVQGYNIGASASVVTHDLFTLLGPPSSPPITFTAQAHVDLTIGCDGAPPSASASIREGASNVAEVSRQQCGSVATDIGITIACQAGATFDLYMKVAAQAGEFNSGGQADARMSLTFPDLPAGYSVVSCQGYSPGPVVPTRRASWGTLKAHYR